MHFRVMFPKQILRAEIFGLCRCCVNPSRAISTGLQDSFKLYMGNPCTPGPLLPALPWLNVVEGLLCSSPNLYRQLEIT